MPAQGEMLTDNRVVLQFRVRMETHPNGHHRLFVENLRGEVVEVFEGETDGEVEHKLQQSGFQRIPPGLADQLDIIKMGELRR